ncbi:MAG: hypothetical protein K1000chlam3_01239 [Chlamydiae bacterium]|nr:hypothetical protein [Chlamydiota bacterium]
MAVGGINPNQRTQGATNAQLNVAAQLSNLNYSTSTIREGEKESSTIEKFKEYFWKGYDWVKSIFVKAWGYIVWIAYCCPGEKSYLEIMEDIIEDPKETAIECAKKPEESAAELVMAALIDPSAVKKMCNENKGKIGTFMEAYKKANKEHAKLFVGKNGNLIPALLAFVNPFKASGHDMFKNLAKLVGNNAALMASALENLRKEVLEVLGENDKENDKKEVKALRLVFNAYLPKVIKQAQDKPEDFKEFFEGLYKLQNPNQLMNVIGHYLNPAPSAEEKSALETVLGRQFLALRWFEQPNLLGPDYTGSNKINLPMTFYQSVLREVDEDQIASVIDAIGENFPLVTAALQQLKDSGPKNLEKISENLPEALEVLAQLKKDYENPPKA